MKIKRYFAADMRQAIRMVREEQGADAVILSNRRVDGGVEIVAAVDYDAELVNKMAAAEKPSATRPEPEPTGPVAYTQSAAPSGMAQGAERQKPVDPVECLADLISRSAPPPAAAQASRKSEPRVEWSQDPSLVAMREEIQTLRGLLESQLNGLAWGEAKRRNPRRVKLLERLTRLGLGSELCRRIAERVTLGENLENNWRQALGLLAHQLPVSGDDILDRGGVVAMVGPTGVGKTTTVAKLAARYALRHGRNQVALVTTDSYRIGAHQQLRTFGNIIGVPVHLANDADELRQILAGLRDKSLVLIDTAGMSQRDMRLAEQFSMLESTGMPVRIYAVLSTTTQRAAIDEVVRAFGSVNLDGCVLTKLDETALLGEALSVVIDQQLPVAYVSDGQRVPEDLQPARANNLVARSVALMQKHAERPADEMLAAAFGQRLGNGDV